jgi:hypothetical protein
VANEQHTDGSGALRQAIPLLLELTGDKGMTQVGRMDVEVERSVIPKSPINRHESLPPQGWCVQIDDRDSRPGRCDNNLQPGTEGMVESLYRRI